MKYEIIRTDKVILFKYYRCKNNTNQSTQPVIYRDKWLAFFQIKIFTVYREDID
ncbi:hypothetical protein [Natronospora cellulosivora (SeqCode)]